MANVKKINPDTPISCKSIVNGELIYISKKSGNQYLWHEFGEIIDVEMADLIQMKQHDRKIMFEPWMIIEDEAAAVELGVSKLYSEFISLENVEEVFSLTAEDLREKLIKLPNGMKRIIGEKSKQLIDNEKIDPTRKQIKALEEALNIDLMLS
ncbi:hypothetical protein [Paenibacillus odorifer]|uniref:hypothetical protein n=1 Tax=Paenibacillus odorifer TaxID=189426 RepID=UPI00096EF502|nr:hypothetical protein [Paenibacillus odorifer]OME41418.1 hypothetical protein BSK58_14905 [Paenibacillus odorifer]